MNSAIMERTQDCIDRFGRTVIGILPEEGKPGFFYSISNHLAGKPEFLLLGSWPPDLGEMVINAASRLWSEEEFLATGFLEAGFQKPFKLVKCSSGVKTKYTVQAGQYYGHEDYEVIQVLLWDQDGNYADHPDCAAPYKSESLGISSLH